MADQPDTEPARTFANVPRVIGTKGPPRDLPLASVQAWDNVQLVRGALVALEQGIFHQAAMMLDAMLGDSHVAAKIDDRVSGLLGAPFTMQPPAGLEEDDHALAVAAEALKVWPELVSDKAERAIARDGILLGVGLGEVVVEPHGDRWGLRLKHWHARWIQWRWDTRSYWVSTMHGQEELQPDGSGGFFSTWRDNAGAEQVSRWFLYTPYGYQRGWVNGRIKAIALGWMLRMWAARDWGRHSEVLGIPPKKVDVPAEWNDEEKQRALAEIAALASEGVILAPKKPDGTGFDVTLLELKGPSAHDTFAGLIDFAEASITVALVGQTLTTQMSSKGGSRAAGEVHERVEDKLRRFDARTMGEAVRACVLKPWAWWNFGDTEIAPVPTWQVDPPEDTRTKGEGMKALGDGLAALAAAGVNVDRARLLSDAGIPLEEQEEHEEPDDDDAAAPGTGPGGVVQDTALNGAQVQAMQAIVQAVADGELPAKAARAMLRAAFPTVTDATLDEMLDGLEAFEPEKPEPPPGAPPPAAGAPPAKPGDDAELARGELARKATAAAQGQVYVDELVDYSREFAARILAGDVKALNEVVAKARRSPGGGIDVEALRKGLLKAYQGMHPGQLARLTEKCLIIAELSGRYSLQKEL